jgi:hypothetical protein
MLNPELRKEMEDFYILLQRILARHRVDIPSNNYDLTLDITPANDGRIRWSYYYACLETRCLFWLHPHDTSDIGSELFSVSSPAHISTSQTSSTICPLFTNRMPEHRLEALYWYVCFVGLDSIVAIEIHSLGPTGLSFLPISTVAILTVGPWMNSWESCPMATWVNLCLLPYSTTKLKHAHPRYDNFKVRDSAVRW